MRTADEGALVCPCHGSHFGRDGVRLHGPSPRNLDGLVLELDDQGRLVTDLSAPVDSTWRLPMAAAGPGAPDSGKLRLCHER